MRLYVYFFADGTYIDIYTNKCFMFFFRRGAVRLYKRCCCRFNISSCSINIRFTKQDETSNHQMQALQRQKWRFLAPTEPFFNSGVLSTSLEPYRDGGISRDYFHAQRCGSTQALEAHTNQFLLVFTMFSVQLLDYWSKSGVSCHVFVFFF